jgi:adenosylmethionine---8-amino-7-oxononanoate aminotransferase
MSDWEKYDHLVWHPYASLVPELPNLAIERAEGVHLYLKDGRVLLDAISSWWVNIHGHAHPVLAEAIYKQALSLEHVIFAGFTHQPALELAFQLINYTACDFKKVFYSDNGSTSVEVALKMALQYWVNRGTPRYKVIALEGAFHGDTFGAMSVSGRGLFNAHFTPLMWEVEYLPFPAPGQEQACLAKFKELLQEHPAALIVEPLLQGAAGMRVYPAEVLDALFAMAQEAGVICIADEVLTGFGRTGKPFASHYLSKKPDIMCLSKGLTGGTMAFGVTLANQKVVEAFDVPDLDKVLYHGHSYTANPIACSVSLASLALLQSAERTLQIQQLSSWQADFAAQLRKKYPTLKRVDQLGTMLVLELDVESGYLSSIRNELYRFFMKRDILLRPLGNVLYFLPPYVIEKQEVDRVHRVILEMLESPSLFIKHVH